MRDLKGVDVLLEALAELHQRAITATIVGSGPDESKFRTLSSSLGLEGRVRFTGALPIRDAFALGRIMVVPSRAESFPYVVLEAAAAGLPLIATNVGGIPEITDGSGTVLIAPGNVQELAAAVTAALDAPDLAKTRAARLKDVVAQKFTVASMADAVLDFYVTPSPKAAPASYSVPALRDNRG